MVLSSESIFKFLFSFISKFDLMDLSLSTENDGDIIRKILDDNTGVVAKVEKDIAELINDERLQSGEGKAALSNILEYNVAISKIDGKIDIEGITTDYRYYSDFMGAGGDLFYNLCENIRSLDFGDLNTYKVDRDKFSPDFILEKMYGTKSGWALKEASGLVLSMFKDGRQVFNSNTLITTNFVKQKATQGKIDNLEFVVENMFSYEMSFRDNILI